MQMHRKQHKQGGATKCILYLTDTLDAELSTT